MDTRELHITTPRPIVNIEQWEVCHRISLTAVLFNIITYVKHWFLKRRLNKRLNQLKSRLRFVRVQQGISDELRATYVLCTLREIRRTESKIKQSKLG